MKEYIFKYNLYHSTWAESEDEARNKLQDDLEELYESTKDNVSWFLIPYALHWDLKVELVEPPNCTCGHSWEDHHHGMVLNFDYVDESVRGRMWTGALAQECEATQVNGEWLVPEEDRCYCGNYVPDWDSLQPEGVHLTEK